MLKSRTAAAERSLMKTTALPKISPRLLTTAEAARLLNVTQRTIGNWIKNGSIPYIELPSNGSRKEYRIPQMALLRSLSGNYDLVAELRALEEAVDAADVSEDELLGHLLGDRRAPE
jgi:excisionase family DNA binding protein